MVVLWARYQLRAVGSPMKASCAATPGRLGGPGYRFGRVQRAVMAIPVPITHHHIVH